MLPGETAGRRGKGPDGRARTREVKLGCVFTQTRLDADGHPVRDPGSASYVSSFETVDRFGSLLYAEALQRGLESARQVIVIGDGAPWIWNLSALHFPMAIQVADLYHAREHLFDLRRLAMPTVGEDRWFAARLAELDSGDIESLLAAFNALPEAETEEVHKALAYFETKG